METTIAQAKSKCLFDQSFLDLLDKQGDLDKAKLHGDCQKSYRICSEKLDGIFN
jgi:hypothetical protein